MQLYAEFEYRMRVFPVCIYSASGACSLFLHKQSVTKKCFTVLVEGRILILDYISKGTLHSLEENDSAQQKY